MRVDLATLDTVKGSNHGFELAIVHPGTRAPLGIYITVLGRDSDDFRRVSTEHSRRRVAKAAKSGGRVQLTTEELDQDGMDLLASCTRAWRSEDEIGNAETSKEVVLIDGEELACSKANALKLYAAMPWIKEQVDEAMADRGNFIKR